ncbi:hypothetical protein C7K70_09640 [Aeromonas hydrophila]|nr:hypothetical protein C7K70_09640 [Aeromonas hydrophila]
MYVRGGDELLCWQQCEQIALQVDRIGTGVIVSRIWVARKKGEWIVHCEGNVAEQAVRDSDLGLKPWRDRYEKAQP